MASSKLAPANTMKKGSYIALDGEACRVASTQISRPGKHGHAKIRIEAIGLIDGKKRDVVMPGHDNVEVPIIEKRNAQVLSVQGDIANVMDAQTYETFNIPIPEEMKADIVEGATVLYWDILGNKVMKQLKSGGDEDQY